ncbi:MAG: nitrous oxide reductase accessory protein NosL [Salegentibacter sp.]
MKTIISSIFVLLLFTSCQVGPEPVNYGSDHCQYCSMTIVDKQYASEIVTKKGKVYKFDAIECMVNYHKEHPDQEVAMFLVSDFKDPGKLISAPPATFLLSDNIASPMAANIAGFSSEEAARKTQTEFGGELFSWDSLSIYLNNQ